MLDEATKPTDPRVDLARNRTNMAGFRTQLALDRTTLAWIRTTSTMASFGFEMVAFFRSIRQASPSEETLNLQQGAIHFGTALILLGIAATVLAGLSHWFTLRRLLRGESPVLTQWPLSITVAMLCAVIGLLGLWTLFAR
ncbi:MAG: YidH family protein [Isosphaeraceae bacterium]